MTVYPVKFEDCEKMGGHCFESTGFVLTSLPPQYPEVCKHCGARRTGQERSSRTYTEVLPPS
jgi:hypothetical protein